jgi:hypothetical protein
MRAQSGVRLTSFGVSVGLISVLKGETTLPIWSYIVALLSSAIVTPFLTLLFARMGNDIVTNQLFKDRRHQSRKARLKPLRGCLDFILHTLLYGCMPLPSLPCGAVMNFNWASYY